MTTAEATVAALIAHGIDTIYALPGVQNDHLFDALFKAGDRIRTVHTRHEQGAAYMALGAALATGKPQAYAVVPGPGLLNSARRAAHRLRHERAGAGADRPDPAGRRSAAASATCTRSATRPASSRGWSIIPRASASPSEAPRLVAEAMRVDAHRPAGPGGARMRDRRLGQSGAGRAAARRCRVREPPIDEDAIARGRQAPRRRRSIR